MSKIAVLIPCLNEGQTIYDVVMTFKERIPKADIYVYDNGSTDNTVAEAMRASAIVCKEARKGKGNVVRRMFREVEDADIYVICDGDKTYDLSNINKMIDDVENNGYDMVVGNRMAGGYADEMKRRFHIKGNQIVTRFVKLIYGGDMKDVMSGLRVFSKRFVKTFPAMSSGFEIETEMAIFALSRKFNVKDVPVIYKEHKFHQSKLRTVRDGIRILCTIVRYIPRYKPVYLLTVSAILALIGILIWIFSAAAFLLPLIFIICAVVWLIIVFVLKLMSVRDEYLFNLFLMCGLIKESDQDG